MSGKELAKVSENYLALTGNAKEIVSENLRNFGFSRRDLEVIKSPTGGATSFMVPGLSGEEPVKELTGILIGYDTPRAYWEESNPVEGTPPQCYSDDSIISHDGRRCKTCDGRGHVQHPRALPERIVVPVDVLPRAARGRVEPFGGLLLPARTRVSVPFIRRPIDNGHTFHYQSLGTTPTAFLGRSPRSAASSSAISSPSCMMAACIALRSVS